MLFFIEPNFTICTVNKSGARFGNGFWTKVHRKEMGENKGPQMDNLSSVPTRLALWMTLGPTNLEWEITPVPIDC